MIFICGCKWEDIHQQCLLKVSITNCNSHAFSLFWPSRSQSLMICRTKQTGLRPHLYLWHGDWKNSSDRFWRAKRKNWPAVWSWVVCWASLMTDELPKDNLLTNNSAAMQMLHNWGQTNILPAVRDYFGILSLICCEYYSLEVRFTDCQSVCLYILFVLRYGFVEQAKKIKICTDF